MTSETRAVEIKLSLNRLLQELDHAYQYTENNDRAPAYVTQKMIYFQRKINDLQRQVRALRNKIPMEFAYERGK